MESMTFDVRRAGEKRYFTATHVNWVEALF